MSTLFGFPLQSTTSAHKSVIGENDAPICLELKLNWSFEEGEKKKKTVMDSTRQIQSSPPIQPPIVPVRNNNGLNLEMQALLSTATTERGWSTLGAVATRIERNADVERHQRK